MQIFHFYTVNIVFMTDLAHGVSYKPFSYNNADYANEGQ